MVRKSKKWPSTLGEVIESRVARESNSDGSHYSPRIVYRYSDGGMTRQGDTVQIGADGHSGSRKQARKTVAQYPVGSEVLVYFDPKQPERACLERRGQGNWVGYVAAIVYPVLLFVIFMHLSEARGADDPVPADGPNRTAAHVGEEAEG